MARDHHRRHRVPVRHVRTAHDPAGGRSRHRRTAPGAHEQPARHGLGRASPLDRCRLRRHLRPDRRLARGQVRTENGDGCQHPRLFRLPVLRCVRHEPPGVRVLPLHHFHRGLRGVRGGHHLARGTLSGKETQRVRPRIHPSVCVAGRCPGDAGQHLDLFPWQRSPGPRAPGRTRIRHGRFLALPAHDRHSARHSDRAAPPVCSGIPDLA